MRSQDCIRSWASMQTESPSEPAHSHSLTTPVHVKECPDHTLENEHPACPLQSANYSNVPKPALQRLTDNQTKYIPHPRHTAHDASFPFVPSPLCSLLSKAMAPSLTNPEISAFTISGVRGTEKKYQHDRMLTSHTLRGTVLAVFDGHGLVPTGHFISDLCVKRFMPILELQPAWKAPVAYRKDTGVINALRKVVEELEKEADVLTDQVRTFSGSTICAIVLRGGWMYSVNVGDSRAMLAVTEVKHLQAVQLTTDHSVSNPIERERIERNGGWVANNRLNGDLEMSRTIGDMEFKKYRNQRGLNHTGRAYGPELLIATPDIEARRISTNDVMVVVATDGLWLPGISNDAVIAAAAGWVRAVGTQETAKKLVGMALEWGSKDNISAVVGVFGEVPEYVRRSRFREFRERRRMRKHGVDKDRTVHGDHSFDQVSEHDRDE